MTRFLYDILPGVQCTVTRDSFTSDFNTFTVEGFVLGEIVKTASQQKPPAATTSRIKGSLFILTQCRKFIKLPFHYLAQARECTLVPIESLVDLILLNLPASAQTSQEQFRAMRPRWIVLLQDWLDFWKRVLDPAETQLAIAENAVTEKESEDLFIGLTIVFADPDWTSMVFSTDTGYLGQTRVPVEIGDLLCGLPGCARPMVLRRVGGRYSVISEAWVSGIMHGELVNDFIAGKWKMQKFDLQ